MELWTLEHAYCVIPSVIAFILITILLNKLIGKKDLKITSLNRFLEGLVLKRLSKKDILERGKYYE